MLFTTNLVLATFTLLANLCSAKFVLTREKLTITDYAKVCHDKGLQPARIFPENLPEIARLMRKHTISQAWIFKFMNQSDSKHHLTVRMVPKAGYRAAFEKHLAVFQYGPDPDIFIDNGKAAKAIPVVEPLKQCKTDRSVRFHGLCESIPVDDSDSESEEIVYRPQRTRYSSGRPSPRQVKLPDSGATLVIRDPASPRGGSNNQFRTSSNRRSSDPDVTIVPVHNPPHGNPPVSAAIDQSTGKLPSSSSQTYIPHFTNDGPTSPRSGGTGSNTSTPRRSSGANSPSNSPGIRRRRTTSTNTNTDNPLRFSKSSIVKIQGGNEVRMFSTRKPAIEESSDEDSD